ASRPTLMTVTNVNSPRRVDAEILDNIMVMAGHGQCVVITPFTLLGAMAPVTLAGALAQQTAEGLGIIALCQLLRVGAPCVLGGFTSNVDMRDRKSTRLNSSHVAISYAVFCLKKKKKKSHK